MSYQLPLFKRPPFDQYPYSAMPNVKTAEVTRDGVLPDDFFITSHRVLYYKINDRWTIPPISSLNCCCRVVDGEVVVTELCDVKKGDQVILGDSDDGSEGILYYPEGNPDLFFKENTVETSFSEKYRLLYERLAYEKEHGGHIVWVMGPSVIFDYDSRNVLSSLAQHGYIQGVIGGNALATHDLEGGYLNTALGQNIYTQKSVPLGHYNHLDLLNAVRGAGSIPQFIEAGHVKNGFIKTLTELDIPFALAGSVRDDGPLPETRADIYEAVSHTKKITDKATLVICLATILHSVSTANLTGSYRVLEDGSIRPVFLYSVDIHENIVNKVAAARECYAVETIVTNVQDLLANIHNQLIGPLSEPDENYFKEV